MNDIIAQKLKDLITDKMENGSSDDLYAILKVIESDNCSMEWRLLATLIGQIAYDRQLDEELQEIKEDNDY